MSGALHVFEAGAGSPVVLLHGTAAPASYFEPLVRRLALSRRVLVPDMPGYGQSPPMKPGASLDDARALLEAELAERGVRDAALVGSSLGGYRALQLALAGNLRATHLVLLGGFATLAPEHRQGLAGLADLIAPMADLSSPDLRKQIASLMLSPAFAQAHPDLFARAEAWLDATRPAPLADEVRATSRCADLLPKLGSLRVPVLCRVGELDIATPAAYSEAIVRSVPGAQLQIVPRSGHALLIEDERATVEEIARGLAAG